MASAAAATPRATPTLAPVLRPEVVGEAAGVAGATLDVGDAVLNEAEAVVLDVVLDLMTKPRLVNV
jgi:hypothetical protein